MSDHNFQKIADLLKTADVVKPESGFVSSAIFQDWMKSAGSKVADHTLDLKKEGGTLVVLVDSNNWAHAVNHRRETILEHMRSEGHDELSVMSIRIRPKQLKKAITYTPSPKQPRPKRISPELREVFENLARKAKKSENSQNFLTNEQESLQKISLGDH